jgi:pyruvate/2-oxoglutarate dehydrogenase complex dihydrolipoamide dehydrogenase (E3) component
VGCELAQAFRRLGSEVTIVQRAGQLLTREDPDVAALLSDRFRAEGLRLVLGANVTKVERHGSMRAVALDGGERIEGDALLIAVGRSPNVEALDLPAANVDSDERGIRVDARLRSSNRRVYAAGDVASAYKFTHAADALARVALQNALFFFRKRATALVVPWCTFTDPEIAHVGMSAREAAQRRDVATHAIDLSEVDRAVVDADGPGLARLHVGRGGRILGATLVARHAGEAIGPVVLAMTAGLRVGALGRSIAPYPTRGEVWKRLADLRALTQFKPGMRRWVERLLALLRCSA